MTGATIIGEGVYSLAEAAGLVRVTSARLSRWVNGYTRLGTDYPPLWRSTMVEESDGEFISFADLMEARVIASFAKDGVRIVDVRAAIIAAERRYGLVRPFSDERFRTDGRGIFLDLASLPASPDASLAETEFDASVFLDVRRTPREYSLIEIGSSQRVFRSIIEPAFHDLEFANGRAVRWWPLGTTNRIVVDPARSFGKPLDAATGVPVRALYAALEEEGSPVAADYRYVSNLYGVPVAAVRQAQRFRLAYAA